MASLFLGALAGLCLYGALHHLQLGLRLRARTAHLLLAAAGLSIAGASLLRIVLYAPAPLATVQATVKGSVTLILTAAFCLCGSVGLRAGLSRRLMAGMLGLSVVHGIVAGWSGAIDVETAPGEGSTFRIGLPRVAPEAAR